MPEICRFYGIVICMYLSDHNPPHFHVFYNEDEVVFTIVDLKIIRGNLPRRVRNFVLEWAFERREELMKNWELAQERKPLIKLSPLE
jgi:hypothetical protein